MSAAKVRKRLTLDADLVEALGPDAASLSLIVNDALRAVMAVAGSSTRVSVAEVLHRDEAGV